MVPAVTRDYPQMRKWTTLFGRHFWLRYILKDGPPNNWASHDIDKDNRIYMDRKSQTDSCSINLLVGFSYGQ